MTDGLTSDREWLEPDGLGGFASGTASGIRTRRYHGLLLPATTPPTGRVMLVNGLEVWATTPAGRVALSSHRYAPGVTHPDGGSRLVSFTIHPWPTWTWDLGEGRRIRGEILVTRDAARTLCVWTLDGPPPVTLEIHPLLSGRDYHALHHENPAFRMDTAVTGAALEWRPYEGLPVVRCTTTGSFHAAPEWFRNYLYDRERERGRETRDLNRLILNHPPLLPGGWGRRPRCYNPPAGRAHGRISTVCAGSRGLDATCAGARSADFFGDGSEH